MPPHTLRQVCVCVCVMVTLLLVLCTMTQILVGTFWLGSGSQILLGLEMVSWDFGDNWRWHTVFLHQKFWFGFGTLTGDVTNFGVELLRLRSQILVSQILIFQAQPRHEARRRTEPDQLDGLFFRRREGKEEECRADSQLCTFV